MRAAEFFAGVGLVRCGLEQAGIEVVWANDIEPTKLAVYAANFDASHYRLDDVRNVVGGDIPSVDLAAASFPCVDLSLAGNRRGLSGEQSGLFYEFTRVLGEMRPWMPPVVLVENVASFVSSHRGEDLRAAVSDLNSLGYVCDLLILDARSFTPQSRPRLFMIGTLGRVAPNSHRAAEPCRPAPIAAFMQANRDLRLQQLPLPAPPQTGHGLDSIVERLHRRGGTTNGAAASFSRSRRCRHNGWTGSAAVRGSHGAPPTAAPAWGGPCGRSATTILPDVCAPHEAAHHGRPSSKRAAARRGSVG